jgi:RHS repeat-associated protein
MNHSSKTWTLLCGIFCTIVSLIPNVTFAQNPAGWGTAKPPSQAEIRAFIARTQNQSTSLNVSNTEEDILTSPVEAAASLANRKVSSNTSLAGPLLKSFATSAAVVTPGGNSADLVTPEIQSLADALGNDPAKIYEYVRNYIEYEDYFGCKKGASLTLLEGSGNSFDQSALLVSLLRAAGFSPEYKYGPAGFTYTQLTQWLGLDAAPYSHLTNAQFLALIGFSPTTPAAEIPSLRRRITAFLYFTSRGYFYLDSFALSATEDVIVIPHVWVSVNINGTVVNHLSPSWKDYTYSTGINLATAMGYSRANMLSQAGGTVSSPDGIANLNYSNVSTLLQTYNTNLLSYLKTNSPRLPARQVTGSRSIVPITANPTLSNVRKIIPSTFSSDWLPSETWTSTIPDVHIAKLQIQLGQGWNATTQTFTTTLYNQTIRMTELRGQKLSLSFAGNAARVHLNETLVGPIATVTAANVQMRLLATHNHYSLERQTNGTYTVSNVGKSNQEEVKTYLKNDVYGYAIVYTFGNAEKHLRLSQERLDAYRRANIADTDWRVFTEVLNVMGLSWMHQTYLQGEVIAPIKRVLTLDHHRFGRISQETSFYIDVGLQLSANYHRGSNENEQNEFAYFTSFFASAMEHGVIEQMQGENQNATSTVKLLYLANQAGQKIYRATGANWSAINTAANLLNYDVSTKTQIQTSVTTNGGKALIPQNAQITLNQWRGIGFALQEPTYIGMFINGGLFGGYNSVPQFVSPTTAARNHTSDSAYILGTSSGPRTPTVPYTTYRPASTDPVDMASGAFFLDKSELSIGGGSAPRGISFSRQYNSNQRYDQSQGLGFGWTHNLHMTATKRSSVKSSLGETISYHGVPFYVAALVVSDLYTNHQNAKEWMTANLATQWFVEQMKYNAVAISLGNKTMEFVRMPDGTYEAPANMNYTLTRTGSGATEAFSVTERNGSIYVFNTSGRIASITDLWGLVQTFTYTGQQLTRVTDGYGRQMNFTWAGDKISSVADTNSRSVGFQYSTANDLIGCTDVESKTWTYQYDTQHRMTRTIDPSSRTIIQNSYDSEGRVSEQLTFGDITKRYKLTYSGYCNTEENPETGRTCYLFDERGRSVGTLDAVGNQNRIRYDGHDRRTQSITPEFEFDDYTFDRFNNLTNNNDPRGENTDMTYDSLQRLSSTTDKRGNVTTINSYNIRHQPLQITAPLSRVSNITYTTTGEVDVTTDPEGNTTDHDYNSLGQLIRTKFNAEITGEFTYNTIGDMLTSKDGLGQTTTYTHNKRRQVLTATLQPIAGQPAAVSSNTYDNEGLLATSTDPRGNISSNTYSPTAKPLTTTLPAIPTSAGLLNNVITHSYDRRDWMSGSVNSLGHASSVIYDAAQRMTHSTDPLSRTTQTAYDKNSRPVQVTDALSRVHKTGYTVRSEPNLITDAADKSTLHLYDENGNCTLIGNRRIKIYNFTFDAANRPSTLVTPLSRTTTTTYFLNDLVKSITEPSGDLTSLEYDLRLRVKKRTDPVAPINYAYDLASNLKTVTEGAGSITRNYDARNRLTELTNADGDLLKYGYDASNNLTSITYPPDTDFPTGRIVNYTYNSRNQLETVTDWAGRVTTYQYDRIGRNVGISRHNNSACAMAFDAASQLLYLRETANGRLFYFQNFSYDSAGQITGKYSVPQGKTWSAPSFTATHDDDNRLLTVNGASIVHDLDGNMTSGPIVAGGSSISLSYNSRNQLTNAAGTSYTYDAEGVRRTVTNASGTTRYTVDKNASLDRLLVKHNPDGTRNYYVYGMGLLYESKKTGSTEQTISYHFDQIGSTIARTDNTGNVLGRAEYSPYGQLIYEVGNMNTPFLYNGKFGVQTDSNGLLNMRARYYSPYLMRFLNADPIGFNGGSNWYSFTGGDPISKNDPFGLYENFGEYMGEVGDVWKGYGDAAVGTVTGLYQVVRHPIQTAVGISNAVAHPVDTYNAVSEQVSDLSRTNRGVGRMVGEVLITAATVGAGTIKGVQSAGTAARGLEFSHWIPARVGGPRTILNGNYVKPAVHALSDPYRYRFMPKVWKAENPMPSVISQQFTRIPDVYKGAAAGAGVAGAAASGQFFSGSGSNNCNR